MPSKSSENVSKRLDSIEARGIRLQSSQEGPSNDGKVMIGRFDTTLPKEQAIEKAARELFQHLAGREYKKPQD